MMRVLGQTTLNPMDSYTGAGVGSGWHSQQGGAGRYRSTVDSVVPLNTGTSTLGRLTVGISIADTVHTSNMVAAMSNPRIFIDCILVYRMV